MDLASSPPLPSAVTFNAWIMVDAGCPPQEEEKCLTLLSSLNITPISTFRLFRSPPGKMFPRTLCPLVFFKSVQETLSLSPPWPHFLLSLGDDASAAARLIKKRSAQKTFTVCLYNPNFPSDVFDVVISTIDDPLQGKNVLQTLTGVSTLTPQKLQKAAQRHSGKAQGLPHPWIGVFIAPAPAPSSAWDKALEAFLARLQKLAETTGGGLLFFCPTSFLERHKKTFESLLHATPHVFWGGNPQEAPDLFEAFLALTDYLLVPEDAGRPLLALLCPDKPIYIYGSLSHNTPPPRFLSSLYDSGLARPFEEKIHFWAKPFLEELPRISETLLARLMAFRR